MKLLWTALDFDAQVGRYITQTSSGSDPVVNPQPLGDQSDRDVNLDAGLDDPDADIIPPVQDLSQQVSQKVQEQIDQLEKPQENKKKDFVEDQEEKFHTFVKKLKNPTDQERVKPLFPFWKAWFLKGKFLIDPKSGDTGFVPGVEKIRELLQDTQEIRAEIDDLLRPVQEISKLDLDLERLKGINDEIYAYDKEYGLGAEEKPPYYQTLVDQRLQIEGNIRGVFGQVYASWTENLPQIESHLEDFADVLTHHQIKGQWIDIVQKGYIAPIQDIMDKLHAHITPELIHIKIKDPMIADGLSQIKRFRDFLSFDDSFWNNQKGLLEKDFTGGNESLDYLQKNNFFSDDSREEFVAEFQKKQADYGLKIDQYLQAVEDLEKVFIVDVKRLSDGEFLQKYTVNKPQFQNTIEGYRANRSQFMAAWTSVAQPDFFPKFVAEYEGIIEEKKSGKTAENVQMLKKWQDFEAHLPQIEKSTQEIREYLASSQDHFYTPLNMAHLPVIAADPLGFARQRADKFDKWLSQGWYFYSISDVWQVIQGSLEAYKTREKQKREEAQAKLGLSFWKGPGQLLFGKDMAGAMADEFKGKVDAANKKKAGEVESEFENKESWEIWQELEKTSDLVRAQVCMNKLNDFGVLAWDDPVMWRFVNRIKGYEYFKLPSELETLEWDEIVQKMRDALTDIYSAQEFEVWQQSIESKRNSAQDKWKRESKEIGKQENVLVDMLKRWKSGDLKNIDPARYEFYVRNAFEDAQMNGDPDVRFYYLIMGVTLKNPAGQTLMSRTAFSRFAGELKSFFPHIDFFKDKTSYKKDGWIVPPETPGAEKRPWQYSDFMAWRDYFMVGGIDTTFDPREKNGPVRKRVADFFYHNIAISDARASVSKAFRKAAQNADHDDAWAYFTAWTDNHTKMHLQVQASGEGKSSEDFWRNYAATLPRYAKHMYNYIKEGDEKWGKDSTPWKAQRKDILAQVGSRLKNAMITIQSLAGNYYPVQGNSLIFTQDQWENAITRSPQLKDSREKIKNFMNALIEEVDGGFQSPLGDLSQLFSYQAYQYGTTKDVLKGDAKHKAILELSTKLLSNESKTDGGGRYFGDTDAIERALEKYANSFPDEILVK